MKESSLADRDDDARDESPPDDDGPDSAPRDSSPDGGAKGGEAPRDSGDELDDDSMDEGAAEAEEGDQPPPRRAPERKPSRALRLLFHLIWLFVVPAGAAVGAVRLLRPDPLDFEVNAVRRFIGDQHVPVTIMFFTFFAIVLWRMRHSLPLAGPAGLLTRADMPPKLRAKYEQSAQLLGEARRILETRKREVERAIKRRDLEELEGALDKLEKQLDAEEVHPAKLKSSHVKAEQLIDKHLGRWRKGELREYAESIGVAVAVALILRFFVVEAFKIPSGSMIPTLMVGDHIFVAKYAYGPLLPRSDTRMWDALPPTRGDVMVFKFPENKNQDFIKRVVALPGDKLEVIDGRPIINGWLAPNCKVGKLDVPHSSKGHVYVEYLGEHAFLTMYDSPLDTLRCDRDGDCTRGRSCRQHVCGMPQGPYQVPEGEVYVMGDNRNNSHDSRRWKGGLGAGVPFEYIKGRAMFVWWSWDQETGMAFDRIGVSVMGTPKLPPTTPPELNQALKACLDKRPPLSETTPPPPGGG